MAVIMVVVIGMPVRAMLGVKRRLERAHARAQAAQHKVHRES